MHDGNRLFQCLQSILRRHVVNTTVPATERPTTDHVLRSNSLRHHVNVSQCDDTFSSLEMIQTRGLPAHVQSECVCVRPHVCCQVYKSTKYQVSVSNTVTEATGFRSIPTSIHKHPCSASCHVPRCPTPSQHISHRMRPNELPQNTFSNNTNASNPSICCATFPKSIV